MKRHTVVFVLSTMLLLLAVALFVDTGRKARAQAAALEASLRSSLAIGDDEKKIERALKEKGLAFSRDHLSWLNQFRSRVDVDETWVVTITIPLDGQDRLKEIEVHVMQKRAS